MSYLDKETNVTEQENSFNEERTYQEMLRADPGYEKWLNNLNCGDTPKPEKENDQRK